MISVDVDAVKLIVTEVDVVLVATKLVGSENEIVLENDHTCVPIFHLAMKLAD